MDSHLPNAQPARIREPVRGYPRDSTVPAEFERIAVQFPQRPALVGESGTLTYEQLHRRANQLAELLRNQGIPAGAPVALLLDRSADLVIAILAVLKVGAIYVPLPLDQPASRLAQMLRCAQPHLLLHAGEAPDLGIADPMPPLLDLHSASVLSDLSRQPDTGRPSAGRATDAAYVMFTSGSTGVPKAVTVPHRAILRLVLATDFLPWGPDLRFLLLAPTAFDASTLELWGPLLHGGACVLFPDRYPTAERLGEIIARHQVTSAWLTAGLFNQIVDQRPDVLRPLRHVLTGGEALSVPHVQRALAALPDTEIINGYGPTEGTTFTTTYAIPRTPPVGGWSSIPIGRPLAQTVCRVLDEQRREVPPGESGELYIGGDGLALGYWQQPEFTRAAFVPDPDSGDGPATLYRSGDRVRWRADGLLEFLGRVDDQLKIRGHRIEPGEVENALLLHPSLREAAIVGRTTPDGGRELVGIVAPVPGFTPTVTELRQHLRTRLPEPMIPSRWEWLEKLPLNPNGKIDRARLAAEHAPSLPADRNSQRAATRALDEVETRLAQLWCRILRVPAVDAEAHFLDLGGHSLLALRLAAEMQQEFRCRVPWSAVFEHPTLAQLAGFIRSSQQASATTSTEGPAFHPVEVTHAPSGPASLGQSQLCFLHQQLPDPTAYHVPFAFQIRGPLQLDRLAAAWQATLSQHPALRTRFHWVDGVLRQEIQEATTPGMGDLVALRDSNSDPLALATEEIRRPFELNTPPLVRFAVGPEQGDTRLLVFNFHHALVDEHSVRLVFQHLAAAYAGQPHSLPADTEQVTMVDYAAWEAAALQSDPGRLAREFWQRELDGYHPVASHQGDSPDSPHKPLTIAPRAEIHRFTIPASSRRTLESWARTAGCSSFMAGLAAYAVCLARHLNAPDLVLGTPFSLRDRAELQDTAGYLLNTLPIRVRHAHTQPFHQVLARVRETVLRCANHRRIAAPDLARAAGWHGGQGAALFRHFFVLLEQPWPALHLPGLITTPVPLSTGAAKTDLCLSLTPGPDGTWQGELECDRQITAQPFPATSFIDAFQALLRELASPHSAVLAHPIPAGPPTHSAEPNRSCPTPSPAQPAAVPVQPSVPRPTDDEAMILAVWAETLGTQPMHPDSDFFTLGGHSLTAMQVAARLKARTGLEIGVQDLFRAPTARALARILEERRTHSGAPSAPALRALPRRKS
ncbi:MAG: amino acid adenylation domain-containing protein [Verrucomicrobiales bacterium]|nr:amino acid adenylation domain-containing protein [Verrucomicrobiales bacterium]